MTSYKPITLGSLYSQDLQDAYFFVDFPFKEVAKIWMYRLSGDDDRVHVYQKFTLRFIAILGNEFALVSDMPTDPLLAEHWKRDIPDFPEATTIKHKKLQQDNKPIITVFPMNSTKYSLKERQVIDPVVHYEVLLKSSIPKTGAKHPRYMTRYNIAFPAMVKVDQSSANRGNFPVYNDEDMKDAFKTIKEQFGESMAENYVITELISDSKETYCCHMYVNKNGEHTWMGATVNISDGDFICKESISNWNENEALQERFSASFMTPVCKYLHNKGYFGWVCLDIVAGLQGDFLVDVNARLAASTSHVLLASHFFAQHKYPIGELLKYNVFQCKPEQLLNFVKELNRNENGKIIVATILPGKTDDSCSAVNISVFGTTTEYVKDMIKKLQTKCST